MQETWIWCLSQEDRLEEGMTIRSSIPAWRIPQTEEPGGLQSIELRRVGHNWAADKHTHCSLYHVVSVSVQSLSRVWLFATPWTAARQASLSSTHFRSLLKLMSIESVMPSLLLSSPFPPALNPFQHQGLFKWVSSSHQVAKALEFQFQISPSNECSGLISFRMDWLDFPAVQGTPKSLLQHHSSKASILLPSAFFIVQLSHPYMTTGKNTALTNQMIFPSLVSRRLFTLTPELFWTGHLGSFLAIGCNKIRDILYIFCLKHGISHFSKEILFLWLESGLTPQSRVLMANGLLVFSSVFIGQK